MLSILIGHNYYRRSSPSGENVVFEAEAALLEAKGHRVYKYIRHSDDIAVSSPAERVKSLAWAAWSRPSYTKLKRTLIEHRPSVAHFHNVFPLITTSAFRACRDVGVPVVLTLHNYRPLCVNGQFIRDGKVCELCLGERIPWQGLLHRCYRDSTPYSAAMTVIQAVPRMTGTWWRDVDVFIAPSNFVRRKYMAGGFPDSKITVKPNFAPVMCEMYTGEREYALFVGRLSSEKGVGTLLTAWKQLGHIPLIVVGDGPLREQLEHQAASLNAVRFVGGVTHTAVIDYIRRARFLVVPSEWYETSSMVILEALACGTPVIASDVGALPEIAVDNHNGMIFRKSDVEHLISKAEYLWRHRDYAMALGVNGRCDFETRYSAESNYKLLMNEYRKAVGSRS